MSVQTSVIIRGYKHCIHEIATPVHARSTVIALHGFGTSGQSFNVLSRAFRDHNIRLIAPDQLGFGQSDKPSGVYSLDLYSEITVGLVDATALDRPFLLGHSAGGKVAACTVARYPDRFAGLILVNSGGFSLWAPLLLMGDTPLYHVMDLPIVRRFILKRFGVNESDDVPEPWQAFERIRGNNRALDIDKAGYRPLIRAIGIPTQLIWGSHDRLFPRSTPQRILSQIPHATYSPMTECGHTPMREDPEGFTTLVSAFIDSSLP